MPESPSKDLESASVKSPFAETPLSEAPTDDTPLGFILAEMRARKTTDVESALALARFATPYLHPKASAKTTRAISVADLSDAELDALLRPE